MKKYFLILTTLALGSMVAMSGCDDRGTGIANYELEASNATNDLTDMDYLGAVYPWADHVFESVTDDCHPLTLQVGNQLEVLLGAAYVPREALAGNDYRLIPTLVLLAPEGGDKFFYFKSGLAELAKEMTASGEIQPMLIYCMSNASALDGYFYGNSVPGGMYDSIIGDAESRNTGLMGFLHYTYKATIDRVDKRGIGGIGQGAYGAFRAAIKHPGIFGSISVADGPLDFDGADGAGGFQDYWGEALTEQEAYYQRNPFEDTTWDVSADPDTVVSIDIVPFSYHRDFDSSKTAMPFSTMLIGGALAFSPNDTLLEFTRQVPANYVIWVTIQNRAQIWDGTVGDYTTFIGDVIMPNTDRIQVTGIDLDFHLPFDSNGNTYNPIWSMWLDNNLEQMHEAGTMPLANTNMWFASNPGAKWGYYDQTQSWISYLKTQYDSDQVMEHPYGSYNGDPITDDEYLFDILREMLIFHSNNFGE